LTKNLAVVIDKERTVVVAKWNAFLFSMFFSYWAIHWPVTDATDRCF